MSASKRPRIALYTYGVRPRGGVVHTIELGEALHRAGSDVVVTGIDDTGAGFFRTPRCPHRLVTIAPSCEDIVAAVRRRIAAYVTAIDRAPDADVHHAQDGISANALATLVERGRIGGFVRTVHHVDVFADRALARLQERSIRSAAQTFAVSALWQRRLAADFGITATLVPSGVDRNRFGPAARDADAPLVFLAVGGIERRKNTIAVLEAYARVVREYPTARLTIAGGASMFDHSPYRAAFAARLRELELDRPEAVRVLGPVADGTLTDLMRGAAALVFPSLVEGFGLVVLEALACETPVVTSRIAPFTEYLTDREAYLVDPEDVAAIASAMIASLDVAQTAPRVLAGTAVAARYSWEASATAHAVAYRRFLARTCEVEYA